jgi:hypothetical protein
MFYAFNLHKEGGLVGAKVAGILLFFVLTTPLQPQASLQDRSMPGMDMAHSGTSDDREISSPGGDASAMHAMEHRHMNMGPHMKMTELRPLKPGDKEKADQVVQAARAAVEKYKDYKAALADGYTIFLPKVLQKQYHFTHYGNAWEARYHFNPSRPTSLLYEKHGNDYKLVGVMYTARREATEDELDWRIPLSIAQWHAHVNFCLAPPHQNKEDVLPQSTKFGLRGSILTKEACEAAGGKFFPQVFGWMVHVYPFAQKREDIWSVERQHDHM